MANDRSIPWALYTGDRAPFRSDKPIWCAWHANHALFASELAPGAFVAVCGNSQIQSSSIEEVQAHAWNYAKNNLGGSLVPRAHIMNFRKEP